MCIRDRFEPKTKQEKENLGAERERLSFDPVCSAHLLTAREHGAKKDAKRVLEALIPKDENPKREREQSCLVDTSLSTLLERGVQTGLTAYLQEIRERLVPIFRG